MKIDERYRAKHTLRDGTVVTLRTIRPRDREELARFVRRLSPETFQRRFHTAPHEVDDAALQYLTEVDGKDHVAVVATTESLDLKDEPIVAVARCIRLKDDPSTAEAAVVVLDSLQKLGLGKVLGSAIVEAASERGIASIRAEVLASNAVVRRLLEDARAVKHSEDEATIVYDVPLDELRDKARAHGEGGDGSTLVQRILRAAAASMAFVVRTLVPLPPLRGPLPDGDDGEDERLRSGSGDADASEGTPRPSFTQFDPNDLP